MVADAAAKIRGYLRENMTAFQDVELDDEDNIFERGYFTSLFAMQLLHYVESTFDIEVPDDYIILQNFSSVRRLADMVGELKASAGE
ncbi:phosphopantetheine attachment site family protein [Micromonospora rosaria]|uniref:Phosphopantetheine attachment site family protein n=2 Tax=Micromonospora rosaria TaxID=47874 RepID=A0A136PLU5_9ACTN|nr:phosphopantetheine attachment site family protein [Micromonospora rosaria]